MREKDFVSAVDAFMPLQKILVSAETPAWQRGRDDREVRLKLPLEVDGEQRGEQLIIIAFPEHHNLMFHLGVSCHQKIVCRLDYELDSSHANKANLGLNNALIHGPHWHPWEENRWLVQSIFKYDRLPNAVPFTEAHQFDAALRWYCAKRNIVLGHHGIEYPKPERLI